jgi:hypothetical protein
MLHWSSNPQHSPEPDGLLGLDFLQDEEGNWLYDVEFDFPARRFRIYEYTPHPATDSTKMTRPTWAGVREFKCVPQFRWEAYKELRRMMYVMLTVSGHSFPVIFDTGAPASDIPTDVAALAGLTPKSPGVVLKDSAGGLGDERIARYRVRDVQLFVGGIPLKPNYADFREEKVGRLGLNSVSDRVVFIASSTGEVCFGPRQ